MHMRHEGFYVVLNPPGFAEENPNRDLSVLFALDHLHILIHTHNLHNDGVPLPPDRLEEHQI